MKIDVLLFAHLKEIAGKSVVQLELPDKATGNDLLEHLLNSFPEMSGQKSYLKISVNNVYHELGNAIPSDAEVAVFPPVSGG